MVDLTLNVDFIIFSPIFMYERIDGRTDRKTDGRVDQPMTHSLIQPYSYTVVPDTVTEIVFIWPFLDSGTLDSGFSRFHPLLPRWIKNSLSQKRYKIVRWGL